MSEPVIPNPTPITREAIPEKVFNQQYITRTIIDAKPNEPWTVKITSVPFDGDAELIIRPYFVEVQDIKACAQIVPEFAAAMEKMIEALGMIAVAAKATNTKQITPENIVATLAAAQPQE